MDTELFLAAASVASNFVLENVVWFMVVIAAVITVYQLVIFFKKKSVS